MSNDENILAYYINQATKTAHDLSKIVREKNSVTINPKNGKDLVLMPVYEDGQASLLSVTSEICPTKITVVNKQPVFVDAYIKKYKDKGNEIVLTDQNYCWTRFYACKELMHHYLYDTEQEATTLCSLHRLILEITSGSSVTHRPSTQYIVDEAAYYGALEFLLPNDIMPLMKASINKLSDSEDRETAIEKMAIWMRVPKVILEFKLNDEEYYTNCD